MPTITNAVPAPITPESSGRRETKILAAVVTKDLDARVYQRAGGARYYLDVRDLGGGREALVPKGERYATTDRVIATDIAAARVKELMRARALGRQRQHFGGIARVVGVRDFAREWFAHKAALCANPASGERESGYTSAVTLRRYGLALKQLFLVLDPETPTAAVDVGAAERALAAMRRLPSRAGSGKGKAAARSRIAGRDAPGPGGTGVEGAVDGARSDTAGGEPGAYVAPRGRTLSAASVRQAIAAMQIIYDHAQDEGVVPAGYNPWRELRRADRPRLPRASSTDFLEVYEGHALLEATDRAARREVPLRAIAAALLLTGGRRDEVLGLEVADVDFARKTVRFVANRWRRIKTGDERTVRLWPQLERELRAYLARHPRRAGLLFDSPRGGGVDRMITGLSRAFDEAAALAGVDLANRYGTAAAAAFLRKTVNPRALRPTYCAARLQTTDGGRPVATWTVRGEMGHSSLKMIEQVYGRLGAVRHRGDVVEFVALDPAEVRAHVVPPDAA